MTKRYYILQKEAGSIYPQVDCLSVFQAQLISAWKMFPEAKPTLHFRLKNKAKLMDVMSTTAGPFTDFLFNEKVKEIMDDSHVMQHQYFKAVIETSKQSYEYYWLHLSQPDLVDALDYEKSKFIKTEWEMLMKGPISIKSYEHYRALKSKDKDGSFCVTLNQIVMTDKFDRSLDLFFLLPFDFNIYVSESLKNKLENSGIKGICLPSSIEIIS